jgi:hypothetical protein
MIIPTIKAILALNLDGRMIMKRLSRCTRSWSMVDLRTKEREISFTNASAAIEMSGI